MVTQLLNAIDVGYEPEIQAIVDSSSAPMDMSTATSETRQRGAKLYGLLASYAETGPSASFAVSSRVMVLRVFDS